MTSLHRAVSLVEKAACLCSAVASELTHRISAFHVTADVLGVDEPDAVNDLAWRAYKAARTDELWTGHQVWALAASMLLNGEMTP